MRKERPGRQVRQLLGAAGTVTAISLAATAVFAVAGFPALKDPGTAPAPAPEEVKAAAVNWAQTPATAALTSALENPPAGWKADGDLQRAVVAPLPYSCPVQNSAASTSLARSYTVGGNRVRVTVQAYTAGLGAEALSQMYSGAVTCAGSEGAVSASPIYGDAPGNDSQVAAVSHGGQRTSVASFRLGDVVAFVTGSNSQTLIDAAVDLDESLDGALKDKCANPGSAAEDASRSPFSLAGYKTFTREESVSIPAVQLPSTSASPSPSPSAGTSAQPALTPYPIPSPELVKTVAEPMEEPSFPVWPAMPEPVALPEAPDAPAPAATTKKSFRVPADDVTGPGCGWAFTGLKAPGFDAAVAEASKKKQSEESLASLEAGAKAWQSEVLTYWKSYADYEKQASAYNKYAEKVAETNRSWAATTAKWDEYWAKMDEYISAKEARESFVDRRAAARSEYEAQQKICAAPRPKQAMLTKGEDESEESEEVEETESKPTKSPTATPSPTPSPTATKEPEPEPVEGCPAEKPEILDEEAPALPDMPVQPADPRP